MQEELNRKQDLLNTLSNSLKRELSNPKLSLMRITYLEEKMELLKGMSNLTSSEQKPDFRI